LNNLNVLYLSSDFNDGDRVLLALVLNAGELINEGADHLKEALAAFLTLLWIYELNIWIE
jgi:hypothetical protein